MNNKGKFCCACRARRPNAKHNDSRHVCDWCGKIGRLRLAWDWAVCDSCFNDLEKSDK